MLKELLSPDVQKFIRDQENTDPRELILRNKAIHGVAPAVIAEQIIARTKAKSKIPVYYNTAEIIFPPGVNLEQSSSEVTAKFKTEIVPAAALAVDLTGGFGVDTFFLSTVFEQVDYVEPNNSLAQIAKHNHHVLGASNIKHHETTAEDFIRQMKDVDLAFIDPSRRTESKKVFSLTESVPNITELQSEIFQRSKQLLVKAAPLLDLKLALKQLRFVKNVYVVSVDNEIKELLFLSERNHQAEPEIVAVNLSKEKPGRFTFLFSEEESATISFSEPLRFLYEPFSCILKAGAFKSIAKAFPVSKLQTNTHLYTSKELVPGFPGRIFEIEFQIKPDKKTASNHFPEGKANVFIRNFPLSPEELKKKMALTDGGEKFVIGFTSQDSKKVVIARRIK